MKIVSMLNSKTIKRKLDNGLTEVKTFDNERLEFHYFLDDNHKRQGLWKCFFMDGTLWLLTNYLDDEMHGLHIHYWANGEIYQKTEYMYNKRHGVQYEYDFAGYLVKHEIYDNGKLVEIVYGNN